MLYNVCPDTLRFRYRGHRQIVKGIKRPNHVRLVVTRKIVAQVRHLETDVPSTRSSRAPIDRLEVIRGTSVGIPPILMRYRMSFFMYLVTQLQLWHLHLPMPVRSASDLHLQVPYMLYISSLTKTLMQLALVSG